MIDTSQLLIVDSAGIVFALGGIHQYYTFFGNAFLPRDAGLETRMKAVSPFLIRETTMWNVWAGFNASHSLGAILIGAIYACPAIVRPWLLFGSSFLLALGFAYLSALLALAKGSAPSPLRGSGLFGCTGPTLGLKPIAARQAPL